MKAALRVLPLAAAQARRGGSKGLLAALVSAAAAASLVVALAIGGAIDRNTKDFFASRYSGEIVVAEGGKGALFGYAMITGNERQEPIARGSEVESIVERAAGLGSVSPLIVGFLSLGEEGESASRCIAFGIDPKRSGPSGLGFALEPGSRLPGPGEILLSSSFARRLGRGRGPLRQGELVTASALKDAGMALRPLRLAGRYVYSGGVSELDSIVYLEAGTARRLLMDADDGAAKIAQPQAREISDDELFSGTALIEGGAEPVAAEQKTGASGGPVAAGARDLRWHYLRLKLEDGADAGAVARSLNAAFAARGLGARALGWAEVSSGYAQSAGIVRGILLGCIAVVAAFALLVLASSLDLLARSRAKEHGTARALGASCSFVFAWTMEEALAAAGFGALAGAAAATVCLAAVSAAAPAIASPAAREVFASDVFAARASVGQAALACGIAVAAAALATLRAARRSARAMPADAMRG